MENKLIIGLEVHIELSTKSKMFCSCNAFHFGKKPNTQVCPICLGLPGALPFPNKRAVEDTLKLGLAFKCEVNPLSKFDRKHYFYPDLPKGFQTSQYDEPFCQNGKFTLPSGKKIRIKRVHLEEDTAKLIHQEVEGKKVSLVDFNRSGVPLVELVTEPDFENTEEVISFLKEIKLIVQYLGISDADMEKGSLRLEANVSIGNKEKLPEWKIELKNINSFKFLEKAVKEEERRLRELLKKGQKPEQETRGFDENKGTTFSQRGKEEAKDYRYFPEPDIPPFSFEKTEIEKIDKKAKELPSVKREKITKLGLSKHYTDFILQTPERAAYFEKAWEIAQTENIPVRKLADAIVNLKLFKKFEEPSLLVQKLTKLSKKQHKSKKETLKQIKNVVKEEKKAVEDFKKGKEEVVGFLIGKTQAKLKGDGDPGLIRKLLTEVLKKTL